jgi:hypothetical protein
MGDVDSDPISLSPAQDGQEPGIKPSTGADAIRAEVKAEQDALHVEVSKLLTEAREQGHLVALVRWLIAKVAP